jgi:AmmeMemoRadiSam system protein A
MGAPLAEADKSELLARARRSGAAALGLPEGGTAFPPPSGRLAEPGAAFVTWKREERLRGCIGSLDPVRPLAVDVESNAVIALLHDPRFPPGLAREFPRYTVQISVLAPFEKIGGPQEISIGLHGLLVEKGKRRGLLLPQVAVEWRWEPETFLKQCCLKAGLPEEAWANGPAAITLWRFEAEVF